MVRFKNIEDNDSYTISRLLRDANKPLHERRYLTFEEIQSLKLRIFKGRHAVGINEFGKLIFDVRFDVFHTAQSILPLNPWLYGDDGPPLPSEIQAKKEKDEQARMLENLKNTPQEENENKNGG
jgi:hypothetical protein